MTTIACNRREMAADAWVSWDDEAGYPTVKLYRCRRSVFGLRGDNWANVFAAWASGGFKPSRQPVIHNFEAADFDVLELAPDGIFHWDKHLVRIPVAAECYAVGTGAKVALYAMRVLDLAPAQAVAEACRIDDYSRPPITVMPLKGRLR